MLMGVFSTTITDISQVRLLLPLKSKPSPNLPLKTRFSTPFRAEKAENKAENVINPAFSL